MHQTGIREITQKLLQVLQRVLNARQFGLKLIANVTYGYTSAGFSGRMPMAELADAIVQVQTPLLSTGDGPDYLAFCSAVPHSLGFHSSISVHSIPCV